MNPDYLKDVRRFGGPKPYESEQGVRFYLKHRDNIDPNLVRTDGRGNVNAVPLVWGKPCFGRPERFVRGRIEDEPWHNKVGERQLGGTICDHCRKKTPGTFEACERIADERVQSDPVVRDSIHKWLDACGNDFGQRCFVGARMKLWNDCLDAIAQRGGWRSVNDDQVKLEALRLKREKEDRQKANRKARKQRLRAERQGTLKPLPDDYFDKLAAERDRRADHLKSLTRLSSWSAKSMRWVKTLTDESCDRIAHVWATRELLLRKDVAPTGQAIAEVMVASGRYTLKLVSLRARVYEDLRERLPRLEDDPLGAPLWPKWTYS